MLPLYHPTTVLVADDEALFLQSFEYSYGDQFLCRLERSPEAAIDVLLHSTKIWQKNCTFQRPLTEKADAWLSPDDFVVQLQASAGTEWMQNPARFSTVSVVIVDYVMPSMSGIDLCRRIKDLPVKKILLTGRAGDHTAVEAFNEGLIDHFLVKHDADIGKKLPVLINQLQHAFFELAAQPLEVLKNFLPRPFWVHAPVTERLQSLLKDYRAIEYYVTTDPAGVVFATAEGRVSFVAVANEDDRRAQREIAEASQAPIELLKSLDDDQSLAVFPTASKHYEHHLQLSWSRHIRPAMSVMSDAGRWWLRVVECSECGPSVPERLSSLLDYRASVDNPTA